MRLPNDEILHYKSDDGISVIVERTELVRCKDCKHHYEETCPIKVIERRRDLDDYCSYGERMDGEGE